ncbi:ATP-dependent DNA helicase RecG [Psychrobacillus antarcticus]|uniref:ATP-dependent DNA helicase RecG n=1 Tax=Psychrobacillus antarcticus TaxID=2879115 RepID=UPI0024086F0A|nr:ATP-dependent DNA helicase RecG [Psychrobacillus antarcticus]
METNKNDLVTSLKGVGSGTANALHDLGIVTLEDLVMTFPYRHEDFRLKNLAETAHNERVTVEGRVESEPSLLFLGKNKSRMQVRILAGQHLIKAVFFNQGYLKDKIIPGSIVTVSGKWDRGRQVINVTTFSIGPKMDLQDFEPVYSLKGLINQKTFRKFMRQALDQRKESLVDPLPASIRVPYRLPGISEALEGIHFPQDAEHSKDARRRFVYEELLVFQLKMQAIKKVRKEQNVGNEIAFHNDLVKKLIETLPYELTNAQKRVVNEICRDLREPHRMNRLLQGDVGSGKTIVAAICLYAVITAGYQGALMAPTEILAEQHASSLDEWLAPIGVRIALLTGSTKVKARRAVLENLATGTIDLLIGTHALIQPDVVFNKLGLVITDEQHRFGVEQRRVLKEKGENPDVLFMTATPIPRTLAITAFGEMDVSIIDEMPAGRKKIDTHWMKPDQLQKLIARLKEELSTGRQAYIICPLIEESEKLDVQNTVDVYNMMTEELKGNSTVGLMHGRLHSDEKEQVMRDFSEGNIHVLVSTTVVEVGVNVPNASFMIIFDAERFGLAQLHQLRGRVGRGEHQSYCVLLADPKSEEGKERMISMTETNDGFILAEKDLELRGPGDFFGKKQSGLPEFKVADLVHDYRALNTAKVDAERLLGSKEFWNSVELAGLREILINSKAMDGERID